MTTGNGAEVVELSRDFGVVAVHKKYDLLSAIHGALDNIEIKDRTRFTEMMHNVFVVAQLSDRELADDTGYAITSVRRWINGKTAPHKSAWAGIRTWCLEELAMEMEKLQTELKKFNHDDEAAPAIG